MDFDRAANFRLTVHETEVKAKIAKFKMRDFILGCNLAMLYAQVGKVVELPDDSEELNANEPPPIVDLPTGGKGRIYPDGSIEI